jgi:hypothetical protein
MFAANLVKDISRRASAILCKVVQPLPDSFFGIRKDDDVVSTIGRLLFLSCFFKSPDRRQKLVREQMSLVLSGIVPTPVQALSDCAAHIKRKHGGGT